MKSTVSVKKKNPDFESLNSILKECDFNGSSIGKNLKKTLTSATLETVYNMFTSGYSLKEIKEKIEYGNYKFSILIAQYFPLVFTEDELTEYFIAQLREKYGNEKTWEPPTEEKAFRDLTGLVYAFSKKNRKSFYLGPIFQNAYHIFYEKYRFPESFFDMALETIHNRDSLADHYELYKNKYRVGNTMKSDRYILILDNMIIPKIGYKEFQSYFHDMVSKYMNDIPFDSLIYRTNGKILNYIFGHEFDIASRFNDYNKVTKNKRNGIDTKYVERRNSYIYKIMLTELFPINYSAYKNKTNRKRVYEILELSTEEQNKYEDAVKKIDKRETFLTLDDNVLNNAEIPFNVTKDELNNAIKSYFEDIINSSRICPSKRKAIKELSKIHGSTDLGKAIRECESKSTLRGILHDLIDTHIISSKEKLCAENQSQFDDETDLIILYFKRGDNYTSAKFNIAPIKSEFLKMEIRLYMQKIYTQNEGIMRKKFIPVKNMLEYLSAKYNVQHAADITEWQILDFLHNKEINEGTSACTLSRYAGVIKYFYTILIAESYNGHPVYSPAINIRFHNAEEHIKPTQVIPDDVLNFLDEHIYEIPQDDYILMYRILIETGWRFSDLRNLTEDAISPYQGDPTLAKIEVSSPKTMNARVKLRIGDKLYDLISYSIYEDAITYINHTRFTRDKLGIKTLFFSTRNNAVTPIRPYMFNKTINKLLKQYNMQSINEEYWSMTSRQARKTVASNMISNGASLAAVQQKLGHVTDDTTEKYYAEVQKMKISELNTKFFEKRFHILLDEKALERFTLQERRFLYVNFCLNMRDVELGKCLKHPKDGPCAEMGDYDCGDCSKLCVGKSNLPAWEKRLAEAENRLSEYIALYNKYNIPEDEYKCYLDYKWEKKKYDKAFAVVNKLTAN